MSPALGWVGFDAVERHFARRALCQRRDRPRLSRRHAGLRHSAGTGAGTACGQRSPWSSNPRVPSPARSAGSMTYCVGLKIDRGLVFMSDTRTNAGIDQHLDLPQDAYLGGARRARDRADVGRQSRHHAGGGQPARRALQGGRRALADAARDTLHVPDGPAGRKRRQGGDRQLRAGRPEGRLLFQRVLHPGRPDPRHRPAPVHDLSGRQFHRMPATTRRSSRSARPNTASRSSCAPTTAP